jgi:Zn-dependent protease
LRIFAKAIAAWYSFRVPMSLILFILVLLIFLFSVVVHEISHGYVAERLGDPTARLAGRLTLNPATHIDPFGSIVLPLILAIPALFGQPTVIFGWAKPVPYDPRNLKNPKVGAGIIAAAGPLANFILAAVFGIFLRVIGDAVPLATPFSLIVYVNILLGVFNLVPIPPLDGSKVLFALLPPGEISRRAVLFLERYGMIILLFFIFFGFRLILPIVQTLTFWFAGRGGF